MVDIKKVSATFTGYNAPLNPLLITSASGSTVTTRRDSLNILSSNLTTRDGFNTVTTKTLYNEILSTTQTYTGFVIPFSRAYSVSLTVNPGVMSTNGTTITLPEIRTYLLSNLSLNLYLYRDNSFFINLGYEVAPPKPRVSGGNTFGHFQTASDFLALLAGRNSATLDVIYDFHAGDFVCFDYVTSVYRPLNGSLVAYGVSPNPSLPFTPSITATLDELSDT